jgi:hypothetical protein
VVRRRRNPATLAEDVAQNVVSIVHCGKVFELKRPIDLDLRPDGPGFVVSYDDLGIEEYGYTEQEALNAFAEHFCSAWEMIAQEDDRKLGRDAIPLKRKLLALVSAVSRQR